MYEEAIALTLRKESVSKDGVRALYAKVPYAFGEPDDRATVMFTRAYQEVTARQVPPKAMNLVRIALRIHGPEAAIRHLRAIHEQTHTTHNLLAALFIVEAPRPPSDPA